MAASAPIDIPGAFVTTQLMPTTNCNVNTNCPFMDISPYVGTLQLIINAGTTAAGAQMQPVIVLGTSNNDFNRSNQVNFGFVTNFVGATGGQAIVNIDLRQTNAANTAKTPTTNSTNNPFYKYLCLEWYIGGSATANMAMDATVIGQKKYST